MPGYQVKNSWRYCMIHPSRAKRNAQLLNPSRDRALARQNILPMAQLDSTCILFLTKDTIELMNKSPQNFERLVLVCIDSYDSEKGRILQHFSRSTRFAILCTAQISKFQPKLREHFGIFFRKFSGSLRLGFSLFSRLQLRSN